MSSPTPSSGQVYLTDEQIQQLQKDFNELLMIVYRLAPAGADKARLHDMFDRRRTS